MKGFFKAVFSVVAAITAVFGALAIVDSIFNKNRIEGDYLDCDLHDE